VFTCHYDNKLILQPDINHHPVNDSVLRRLYNAANPNAKKDIDVSFSAALSGVPYEISEYPSSFLMYDCRLMTPTKYYAHRLTQKVFLKTVQIFKPLIHEKEYEDITTHPKDDDGKDSKYASIFLVEKMFTALKELFDSNESFRKNMKTLFPELSDTATISSYYRTLFTKMDDDGLMQIMWVDGQHRNVFSSALLGGLCLFQENEIKTPSETDLWEFCDDDNIKFAKVGCSPQVQWINFEMNTFDSRAQKYARNLSLEFVNQKEVAGGRSWNDLYVDCIKDARNTKKLQCFFISNQATFTRKLDARGETIPRIILLENMISKMSSYFPGVTTLAEHQTECKTKEVTQQNILAEVRALRGENKGFYFGAQEIDHKKKHVTPMLLRAAAYWLMTAIHDAESLKAVEQFIIKPSFHPDAMCDSFPIDFYHPKWLHEHILVPSWKFTKNHYRTVYHGGESKKEGGRRARYFTNALVVSLTNVLIKYGPNPPIEHCEGKWKNMSLRLYHLSCDTDCVFSTFTKFLSDYLLELNRYKQVHHDIPQIHSRSKYKMYLYEECYYVHTWKKILSVLLSPFTCGNKYQQYFIQHTHFIFILAIRQIHFPTPPGVSMTSKSHLLSLDQKTK
jgi:hypothetical protein